MPTTRLRKTFHYPSSSSSSSDDSFPPELDTDDQTTLIQTLSTHDTHTTNFYTLAFLFPPLLSIPLYLPSIFLPSSARAFLIAVLSVSVLAATAWILWFLPAAAARLPNDGKGKRAVWRGDARGPVERYMVVLVGALAAVLGLVAVGAWRRGLVEEFWRGVLPGAIFLVVMFARSQLRPVDTAELERLKYNYRGA